MFVPLELHAEYWRQRVQLELLDRPATLLTVAAPVRGLRQLLWCTVAHETALQRIRCRVRHRRRLITLLAHFLLLAALGRRIGARLETQVQEGLACVCDALARWARHAALQAPPKRAVYDTRARRVMVWRARLTDTRRLCMLAQLRKRRRIVPGAHWQLDAVVGVGGKCGMNPIQRTNKHFVRIMLSRARKLRGRGVHPDGVQERCRAMRSGRVAARKELSIQLVHLACQAVAPGCT